MEIKQVVVVRKDLKMSKGKVAAQVSHASVDCMLKSHKDMVDEWRSQGMKKVVLKVENLDQLTNESERNIQLPKVEPESSAPYVMLLLLLGIVGATITYLRKEKAKAYKKDKLYYNGSNSPHL